MLRYMRKQRRSFIVKGVLGIIILVFVGWGVGSFDPARQTATIASVNDINISLKELNEAHQNLTRTYQELYGASFSPELARQLDLQGRALDNLITAALLRSEARSMGLTVTDDEVADSIRSMASFRPDGRFDKATYLRFLRFAQITDDQFVDQQRDLLLTRKVESLITDGARVSDEELRARYMFENQRANLRYVKVPWNALRDRDSLTDEELSTYYEENTQRYRKPARVVFSYLAYKPENFASTAELTDEDVTRYYEDHVDDRFTEPPQVDLLQIVLAVPAGTNDEERQALRKRANDLVRQATDTDFATLAREYSSDKKSAENGGALGWVAAEDLPPQVAGTAFALEKGSVSEVIDTGDAFYILKVADSRASHPRPLDEVRDEITAALAKEQGRDLAREAADEDATRIVGGATLEQLAETRGLHVIESKPLAAADFDPQIGRVAPLVQAAMGLNVGETSDTLETARGFFLVRPKEKEKASALSFEEARTRVTAELEIDRAKKAAREKAVVLLAELQNSKDIDALAARENLSVAETGPFGRSGRELAATGLDRKMAEDAFTLSADDPVCPRVYVTPIGDAAIAMLKEQIDPDMEEFTRKRDTLRDGYLQRKKQALLSAFITQLKQSAEIEVRSDFLPQT